MRTRATQLALTLAAAVALTVALLPGTAAASHGGHPRAAAKHKHKHKHARHRHAAAKQRPTYWGAWLGDQLTGTEPPWDMSAVTRFEGIVGKGLSLVAFGSPFADCQSSPCSLFSFPTTAMENIESYGAIPFFNWASQESSSGGSAEMPNFQLADLIAGTYDSYIREFAEAARDWGHPFFLRFDWEMNGDWFPWSEGVNGNGAGEFVAAWRHVHDIFATVGATNATWVWCPYAENKVRVSTLRSLYPGGRYVDWTCMDGFNWTNSPKSRKWTSFQKIFTSTYGKIVKRVAPHKPVAIAEFASAGPGPAKARWIRRMFKTLRTEMRQVRALIWFDQVDRTFHWPIETSPAVTRAFAAGIRGHGFKSNGQVTPVSGPIRPPS